MLLTPGYVDIHVHGAWGMSFDDGADGIRTARAGHMLHGTTRPPNAMAYPNKTASTRTACC